MVKFNPGLSQILRKVFLSKNMSLELKKSLLRFSDDSTECYSKQRIVIKVNAKMEQNFPSWISADRTAASSLSYTSATLNSKFED